MRFKFMDIRSKTNKVLEEQFSLMHTKKVYKLDLYFSRYCKEYISKGVAKALLFPVPNL